jgi:uncharacterized protein (TIGR02270 family)
MTAQSTSRPIGFTPLEISALVQSDIVSQHAEEAAFLWTLRRRAVGEPHYALKDLAALDERVEAHLEGLRVAGPIGWEFCKRNLAHEEPGEIFALSVLAFGAGNRDYMREALYAGCASPKLRPGLISALGWLDHMTVAEWLQRLLEAKPAPYRSIGIAGCAVHREDPGAALDSAVNDVDSVLRARALRCVGEIKRHDLLDSTRGHLHDADEACRFWAAWATTLLGAGDGVPVLMQFVEQADGYSERALQLVLRTVGIEDGRKWLSSLAKEDRFVRTVVMGAGILGDPAFVPWLIRRMESPVLARLAGEAFTTITGVDLAYLDLSQDAPPEPEDDDAAVTVTPLDYESNLPWPSPPLVREWWLRNQHMYSEGSRYLSGKPVAAQSLVEVLAGGKQRLRAAAALELALLNRSYVVFEVRARGSVQQARLEKWIL